MLFSQFLITININNKLTLADIKELSEIFLKFLFRRLGRLVFAGGI